MEKYQKLTGNEFGQKMSIVKFRPILAIMLLKCTVSFLVQEIGAQKWLVLEE